MDYLLKYVVLWYTSNLSKASTKSKFSISFPFHFHSFFLFFFSQWITTEKCKGRTPSSLFCFYFGFNHFPLAWLDFWMLKVFMVSGIFGGKIGSQVVQLSFLVNVPVDAWYFGKRNQVLLLVHNLRWLCECFQVMVNVPQTEWNPK